MAWMDTTILCSLADLSTLGETAKHTDWLFWEIGVSVAAYTGSNRAVMEEGSWEDSVQGWKQVHHTVEEILGWVLKNE